MANPNSGAQRGEMACLFGLLVLAALLRWASLSQATVEHFDEGVYASNLWFGAEAGYGYPARHLYAPPLLPALIEWTLVLTGNFATGPLGASLVAGTLTPWLVWRIGRRWFSPVAGLAAAALAAGCELHVLYSRTALTDVLLVAWILVAVDLSARALERLDFRLALLAGLATGAAWWTKYNGWLPLAISGAGMVVWWMGEPAVRSNACRHLALGALMALVAALVWCPVLWGLQSYGGYASVAANHRTYVVGFSGWLTSCDRQWANLQHFEGWVSVGSLFIASLVAWRMTRRALPCEMEREAAGARARTRSPAPSSESLSRMAFGVWPVAIPIALAALSAWWGVTVMLLVLTGVVLTRDVYRQLMRGTSGSSFLPRAFLGAWVAGLLVATPLYWPYARLTLPLVAASWLGGGYAVASLYQSLGGRWSVVSTMSPQRAFAGLGMACFVASAGVGHLVFQGGAIASRTGRFLQSRATFASIATELATKIPETGGSGKPQVMFVYGEPALFYQLRAQGADLADLVLPAADLVLVAEDAQSAQVDVLLVTGPHAHRSNAFLSGWSKIARQSKLIFEVRCLPSDLVLLDHLDPRTLAKADLAPWQVRIYRIEGRPPASHL